MTAGMTQVDLDGHRAVTSQQSSSFSRVSICWTVNWVRREGSLTVSLKRSRRDPPKWLVG